MVVAALIDDAELGRWAEEVLLADHLATPHLMPVEAANILRRAAFRGDITADVASLAHADLQEIQVDLFPYGPVASRSWELRNNLTLYDGWYVALAELLEAELATLDERVVKAPGPRCRFLAPSA